MGGLGRPTRLDVEAAYDPVMDDLPAAVTRFDRITERRIRRFNPVYAFAIALMFGLFVVLPLVQDGDPTTVLAIAATGLLVSLATVVLSGRIRLAAAGALALVGAGFAVQFGGQGAYALIWFAMVAAGQIMIGGIQAHRQRSARIASAVGAPAIDRNPQLGKDVGVLALWGDQHHEYEAADPSADLVVSELRNLDGDRRTWLSVFHGKGRLDVGGDASSQMVVVAAEDRANWHVLRSGDETATGSPPVPIAFEFERLDFPADHAVSAGQAEHAVRHWIATGTRDPDQSWWADSTGNPAPRPTGLRWID